MPKPDVIDLDKVSIEESKNLIKEDVADFIDTDQFVNSEGLSSNFATHAIDEYSPSETDWMRFEGYTFRFVHVSTSFRKTAEAHFNTFILENKPKPQKFIRDGEEVNTANKNPAYLAAIEEWEKINQPIAQLIPFKVYVFLGIEIEEEIPPYSEWAYTLEKQYKKLTGKSFKEVNENFIFKGDSVLLNEILFKENVILKHPRIRTYFENFVMGDIDRNFKPIKEGFALDMFRSNSERSSA